MKQKTPVRRVIYLSTTQQNMPEADLYKLCDEASSNAARDGLTGLTVFHRSSMFHLREGEADLIGSSIVRAGARGWHYDATVVFDDAVKDRLFDKWYLSFAPSDINQMMSHPNLLSLNSLMRCPETELARNDIMFRTYLETFLDDVLSPNALNLAAYGDTSETYSLEDQLQRSQS